MYRVTIGFVVQSTVSTTEFDFQQKPEEIWKDYSVTLKSLEDDRAIYVSTNNLCFFDTRYINNDQ